MDTQKSIFIINLVLSLGVGYGSGVLAGYYDNNPFLNVGVGIVIGFIWFTITFYIPIIPGFLFTLFQEVLGYLFILILAVIFTL